MASTATLERPAARTAAECGVAPYKRLQPFCEWADCSAVHVYREHKRGRLRLLKMGNATYVDVQSWLDSLAASPAHITIKERRA